ncbi:transposase, MuDR, MULE transposase domain protein [Artemisia annua]|uniref:Transposase, MuDR, MULE transposase domain protein n=1 Tax=Artemisia annua TaxID=35608 RepID=A0A2U1NJC5_ARTAN|nr:transposase, MuDR, MULE transposase domain protein [Artemisia annua]
MQYCYKIPNGNLDTGLYMLNNDNDVLGLIKHVDKCKLIELYVMYPVDLPKITDPNEVPNLEEDFDPFFCDLDPENGESSARPKQTDPNDNPSVSEPNNADGVVSDHSKQSDGSEESSDSDASDDRGNIIDDVEVDMEDFRKHTDANVEWVGCNEAQDEPVEQNEPCLGEEDLEEFGSGTDSDDPECNRKRALKKLANQHKPVDGKFYSDNFFVGQSFGNKGLIKEMVTGISVDSRRDIYLTRNDKTRVRAECRGIVPVFSEKDSESQFGPSGPTGSQVKKPKKVKKKKSPCSGPSESQIENPSVNVIDSQPCPWLLHCSKSKEETWYVKIFEDNHTCLQTRNVRKCQRGQRFKPSQSAANVRPSAPTHKPQSSASVRPSAPTHKPQSSASVRPSVPPVNPNPPVVRPSVPPVNPTRRSPRKRTANGFFEGFVM